jgi:hypothetical protein
VRSLESTFVVNFDISTQAVDGASGPRFSGNMQTTKKTTKNTPVLKIYR